MAAKRNPHKSRDYTRQHAAVVWATMTPPCFLAAGSESRRTSGGVRTAQGWAEERAGHSPKLHLIAYSELIDEWNGGPVRLDAIDNQTLIAKRKKLRADSRLARRNLRDGVHFLRDRTEILRARQTDFRKMRDRSKSSGKS
jgi:hypothetical protein